MEKQDAPTTVKEVGIHVGYLREDVTEIKNLLQSHIEIAATKAEVERLNARVDKLEARLDARDEEIYTIYRRVAYIVICGLVLMVLAQYGLDRFFRP